MAGSSRLSAAQAAWWAAACALVAAPVGAAVWLFVRSRHNVRELTTERNMSREKPVAVPRELQADSEMLQLPADGDGPLFHRRYRVDIAHSKRPADDLMREMQHDINLFSPQALASFTKTRGDAAHMAVGDQFDIAIAGPWNGAVCVIDHDSSSFSLVTLKGHPEAGQIRFRFQSQPTKHAVMRFEILSWARSRDMLVSLAYGAAGKEVQKNVWIEFCRTVVERSGGELLGEIVVLNEERPFEEEVVDRA